MNFEELEAAFTAAMHKKGLSFIPVPLPPPIDKVYTIKEVAEILHKKYRTVQSYIENEDLGCMVNDYGEVTIKQSDIDAFRELGTRRRTKKETSREADKVLDRIGGSK